MSEDREQLVEETVTQQADGPFGGERLAEARREQQISIVEIAKELHLDEAKVRALEHNEFDMLGAAVFAKGHLRKYAEMVGVDAGDVLADYYKMTHTADLPPVVSNRPRLRQEMSPGPWIALIAVLVVVAGAYWWFAVRPAAEGPQPASQPVPSEEPSAEEVQSADEPAADVPDEQAADAPDQPAAEDTDTVADGPESGESAADPGVEVPEPAATSAVADDQMRLSLSFSGDCWTEISDADGRRLFFEMGRSGRTLELTGTPPISILFGNVENVSLRVDGSDYPVAPANPGSRTARLTIVKP